MYSPNRTTHDCVIHQQSAKPKHGYIGIDHGGVVGSSEWIWIKEADAQLISAAPDLLAALKMCNNILRGHMLPHMKSQIDDALLKAEGRS